jgi:hypothetical protein
MALPPTIPTSFVPRPSASTARRSTDFTGAFAFLGYGVLAVVVALAIGAFVYSRILAGEQAARDTELKNQIAAIDPNTVTKFVHLRDRLARGMTLLNQHVALTGFWDAVITIVPSGTRFKSLHLTQDTAGGIKLEGAGVAKSFNALAATSDAFAKDGRIKDAIFSSIRVDGSAVSFSLTATIDPALIAFAPKAAGVTPPPSAATSTAPTTP